MKFTTYKAMEYREQKVIRKERKQDIKLQTESINYETAVQESFFSAKSKATR